jgi:spermidine/putrescine transport system substrate-binding protein
MGGVYKMEKNRFFDLLAEGKLTRRQMTQVLASIGVGLATVPVFQQRAMAAGEISYFTWAGYEIPELHPAYIEKYDGAPEFSIFGEEEEALQKMRSGFVPDVSHPCTYSVARWRDAGILAPVDASRLSHYGDIFPELRTIKGTVFEDQPYFVPCDWGNSSILYRADLVEIEEESWGLLFDERYAGRLAVYDSVDGAVTAAALTLGVSDPFNMTDEELTAVRELMVKQKDMLRYYWTDQTAVEQGLATGELVAAYAWNSSVVTLKQQGLDVKYMNPKEGILTWVCGLVLIEGGPGDEQAKYDFIDSMIAPEAGQYLIDAYGYGHSNMKSFDLVSIERLEELGISSPEALFAQGIFFEEINPAVREKYISMFEEVKAGI